MSEAPAVSVEEKHIILHLYTTNGGITNNLDLINPTDKLSDLISQETNIIHKDTLTKQSLQEAFGEASDKWIEIKQLLNNYVKDNTPKSFGTLFKESGKNLMAKSYNALPTLPNLNPFSRNKTAKVSPEVAGGGSRKMKKTRKIRGH